MNVQLPDTGTILHDPLRQAIDAALGELCPIHPTNDGIRITTQCLYPSNGLVRVFVRGGARSVIVSDDGEAVGEAIAAGIEIDNPDKILRSIVRDKGLMIEKACLYTNLMPIEDASVGIVQVANAARDISAWLLDRGGISRRRDFRKLLSAFLADMFRDQVAESQILGASHKPHKFPNVISFANGRKLIIDAVANDPSSINSRVVANFDVKSLGDRLIEQRIIYDDMEKWSASDLNLLQIGATLIPFSRAKEVIEKIAEATRTAA